MLTGIATSGPSSHSTSFSRKPVGTVAATDIATSSSKTWRSVGSTTSGLFEQEVQLVVPEQAQIVEVAAADEHPIVDPEDLGVGHVGMEQDRRPGREQSLVVMAEGGRRVGRCRLSGRHDPGLDTALGGLEEALEDRPVGDVRVDDVDDLLGFLERLLDRIADRMVALAGHVPEDGRRDRRPVVAASTGRSRTSAGK